MSKYEKQHTMQKFEKYILDVEQNKIITNNYIKLAVKRFKRFQLRDDMYFDYEKVDHVIKFIYQIKHFKGAFAGKNFILEDWQEFFIANIFGFYWKKDNTRVCRNVFLSVARKNGKSALVIGIILYMLFFSDNGPEIVECANAREQAKEVLLNTTVAFAKSLDPNSEIIKSFRNEIKTSFNNGQIKIVSADSSKLDGLNLNCFVYDEFAEAKNDLLYSVLQSSMGNRLEPLSIICGTVSFNLSSPYFEMYEINIEILNELKEDDSQFSLIYTLDEEDDYLDERVWGKANPNLNISIYENYLRNEVLKGKNNSSLLNKVLTKNFNIWCSTNDSWITNDKIISHSQKLKIEDFYGENCWVGCDLASTDDLTAVSYLFVKDEKYYFFVDYYLPQSAMQNHLQKEFYKKMYFNHQLKLTDGNATNYNMITEDILRISQKCNIQGCYYDSWNATKFAIDAQDRGLKMFPVAQNISSFSKPTKEFYRLFLDDKIILDDNELTRFCFNNVFIWRDSNENEKVKKLNKKSKIDGVIANLQSLFGQMTSKVYSTEIFGF